MSQGIINLNKVYKSAGITFQKNLAIDPDLALKADMALLEGLTPLQLNLILTRFVEMTNSLQNITVAVNNIQLINKLDRGNVLDGRVFDYEYGEEFIDNIDAFSERNKLSTGNVFSDISADEAVLQNYYPYKVSPRECEFSILDKTRYSIVQRLDYFLEGRLSGKSTSLNVHPTGYYTFPVGNIDAGQVDYPSTSTFVNLTLEAGWLPSEALLSTYDPDPILPDYHFRFNHAGPEHWRYDTIWIKKTAEAGFYIGRYKITTNTLPATLPYDILHTNLSITEVIKQLEPELDNNGVLIQFVTYYLRIQWSASPYINFSWIKLRLYFASQNNPIENPDSYSVWALDGNMQDPVYIGIFSLLTSDIDSRANTTFVGVSINIVPVLDVRRFTLSGDHTISLLDPRSWTISSATNMYNFPTTHHCGLVKVNDRFYPCNNVRQLVLNDSKDIGINSAFVIYLPYRVFNSYEVPDTAVFNDYIPRTLHSVDTSSYIRFFANGSSRISNREYLTLRIDLPVKNVSVRNVLTPYITSSSVPTTTSFPANITSAIVASSPDAQLNAFRPPAIWFANSNIISLSYFVLNTPNYFLAPALRVYGVREDPSVTDNPWPSYYQKFSNINMHDTNDNAVTTVNNHPFIVTPNLDTNYWFHEIQSTKFVIRTIDIHKDDLLIVNILPQLPPGFTYWDYVTQHSNV